MLGNENSITSYQNYEYLSFVPNVIVNHLIESESEYANRFWKILKYPDKNCLEMNDLTIQEKINLMWDGSPHEEDYKIFLKPLVGDSLPDSDSQIKMHLFRLTNTPTTSTESIPIIQFELYTHEKCSMIYYDNILVERTDVMCNLLLNILNGMDIKYGVSDFVFDRELDRSLYETLNINNSKSFFGRTFRMGFKYANLDSGGGCG